MLYAHDIENSSSYRNLLRPHTGLMQRPLLQAHTHYLINRGLLSCFRGHENRVSLIVIIAKFI